MTFSSLFVDHLRCFSRARFHIDSRSKTSVDHPPHESKPHGNVKISKDLRWFQGQDSDLRPSGYGPWI